MGWNEKLDEHIAALKRLYPERKPDWKCKLGFHKWYDSNYWAGRVCTKCGRMEQMSGYSG